MFRIYFDKIGKDKQDDVIETDARTLDDAENIALLRCRAELSSNKVMLDYQNDLNYIVLDGLDVAGQVEIKSI